jgi:hypothetical protein
MRLLLAQLDSPEGHRQRFVLLREVQGCPDCLTAMLLLTAAVACKLVPEPELPSVAADLSRQLSAALDRINESGNG